ncbi:MAG: colanic acid biosynthesis acetyltransferase WcaF [Bacteroidetes bacterium]|nr:MAG: colanic acid biosynthesis acetyltransferase WcaF [Bacteroidota bacterium]
MNNPVDLSKYNNDWYKKEIGASRLKQMVWYCINVLFFISPILPGSGIKRFFLRAFGAKVGEGVVLKPSINIKYPWKLTIGDHSWIGERVWIDNLALVEIGKNVCVSQGALLLTGNHDFTRMDFDLIVKKIVLEDGVWIGAKAMVCPGVICESHAVLAAGSIATQNLESYKIYQGNPAICVKERMVSE